MLVRVCFSFTDWRH